MLIHTVSSTPLDDVTLEPSPTGTHVWLRKNITETTADDGTPIFEADEVYYFTTGPVTRDQIRGSFDSIWTANVAPAPTEEDSIAAILAALAELGDMIGGE